MTSISLLGLLSPRARAEQGGMRHAARAQRRPDLLQSGKEVLAVHGSFIPQNVYHKMPEGGGGGASMA
jgi:hypothetical protein